MATHMQLEDWLDDLCVRFIINLPEEDLSSVARICFQVEEAQWFYEDFIRPLDPILPSMSLRTFCLRMFQHCPLLAHFSADNHTKAFEEFLEYKTRVPVRGAILLNEAMDSMLLVKGWKKGATWTFPGGKINKDEDDLDCAVREVWEETGLDLHASRLVPSEGKPKYIEIPIRNHQVRLYVFRDIPMDYYFEPQTRKEISKIEWYKLSDLPAFRKKNANQDQNNVPGANKFYMIAPFMVPLKKWIASQKRHDGKKITSTEFRYLQPQGPIEEVPSENEHWTQPVSQAPPSSAAASLDDATQELQRLLKLQSPAYSSQRQQDAPASVGDKGSALLSLLQANTNRPADAVDGSHQYSHQPHTPYGLGYNQPPQPQNPHHQANQHHMSAGARLPPPSFPLPGYHSSQGWDQTHPPSQHQSFQPPQDYSYHTPSHHELLQHQNQSPIALMHPQPLPPQVRRAVFNRSTFQETPVVSNSDGPSHARGPPHYQPAGFHDQAPAQVLTSSYGQAHPSGLADPSGAQAPPASLSGQSQALLNAFKRDPIPTQAAQLPHPAKRPSVEVFSQVAHKEQYPQYSASQGAPNPPNEANMSRPMHQQSPSEVSGTGMGPPADHHKSALLGIFTKATPDAGSVQKAPQQQLVQPSHIAPQGLSAYSHQVPRQSRSGVSSHVPDTQVPQGTVDKRMEHLALFNRKDAQAMTAPRAVSPRRSNQGNTSQSPVHPHNQTQQAPVRILQRGQDAHAFELTSAPKSIAQPSSHQARDADGPLPRLGTSRFHQQAQPAIDHRRPSGDDGTSDQKRQLLSLFGGAKQSPSQTMARTSSQGSQGLNPLAIHAGTHGNAGRADGGQYGPSPQAGNRQGGSNSGDKTPMSPADQSFLLGYLQSVTGTSK